MLTNCGSRLICFHCQVLWQILGGTNALCFQLLTLIAAYWLPIGPIVRPNFSIFIISFLIILQKMSLQKRVTNYWTTIGVHCLILSSHFSTAEVLLLMAWWTAAAKTTFILKTVQPLMVRLSLACGLAFQKKNFKNTFLEIAYCPCMSADFEWFPFFWFGQLLMWGSWIRRAGQSWYLWYARGCPV